MDGVVMELWLCPDPVLLRSVTKARSQKEPAYQEGTPQYLTVLRITYLSIGKPSLEAGSDSFSSNFFPRGLYVWMPKSASQLEV